MRKNRIQAYHSSAGSIENSKRRHALPAMPAFSAEARFFERILNVRKTRELVFITKTAAKNR